MSTSHPRPGRASSRDRILGTAASIVAEHGVQHLTIEATAAAAGLSKAGLIYHFKTRDELLSALVERMASEVDLRAMHSSDPSNPVPMSAQLAAQFKFNLQMPAEQKLLFKNMLEAAIIEPKLLAPMQGLFERDYAAFGSGSKAGLALLLAAAADSIVILEILQLYQFSAAQRQALEDVALELARTLD
jgi:AcrR family transcriptional regulator